MKSSFNSLSINIDTLVTYIQNHEKSNSLLDQLQTLPNDFQEQANLITFNTPTMRVFEYNCYIISLYGYFEQFIESILTEYLDALSSLHLEFNELPNEIKKNNIRKNTDLLNSLELPKYRTLEAKSVISTLHDNELKSKTKINTIAFSHHSANFRIKSICEYFKAVGVNDLGKAVASYEPLKSLLFDKLGDHSQLELTTIYEVIDELVERRNSVAHGVIEDDILNTNRIVETCTFIKKFSESLKLYLSNLILKRLLDKEVKTGNKSSQELTAINIFNSNILCINSNNLNISVGSKIIIHSANLPKYQETTIQSIQIEGKDTDAVTSEQSINIALCLDKKIKNTNSFYIILST